jgi:hypothetical protein
MRRPSATGGSIGSGPWGPGSHTTPRQSADLMSAPRPALVALGPDPVNDGYAQIVRRSVGVNAPTSVNIQLRGHPVTGGLP